MGRLVVLVLFGFILDLVYLNLYFYWFFSDLYIYYSLEVLVKDIFEILIY